MTTTLDEFIAEVSPTIHAAGSGYYGAPLTLARSAELGLDGSVFPFYVIGRGGMLGDVDASLVVSSFGYFEPSYLAAVWNAGRRIVSPTDAAVAHFECCAEVGRRVLAGHEGLDAYCAAAAAVNAAADPIGLPLYAAFQQADLAQDVAGRALQLTAVLRELRGSAHLLAVRACGLDAKSAHLIERPHMAGAFGWTDDPDETSLAERRQALDASERLTNELVRPALAAVPRTARADLLAGAHRVYDALLAEGWGGPTKPWTAR